MGKAEKAFGSISTEGEMLCFWSGPLFLSRRLPASLSLRLFRVVLSI